MQDHLWSLVDDALADTGPVVVHPRHRKWARMHAVNLLLGLEGMDRHPPGSQPWMEFLTVYLHSERDLESALGSDGKDRVVKRLAALARAQDLARLIN